MKYEISHVIKFVIYIEDCNYYLLFPIYIYHSYSLIKLYKRIL